MSSRPIRVAFDMRGCPSRMRPTSKLVPPMSVVTMLRLPRESRRTRRRSRRRPGPTSGWTPPPARSRRPVQARRSTASGAARSRPRPGSCVRRFETARPTTGRRLAFTAVVSVRRYSPRRGRRSLDRVTRRAGRLLIDLGQPALVRVVLERPQERDGEDLCSGLEQRPDGAARVVLVERQDHPAEVVDPLGHLGDQALRDDGLLLDERPEVLDVLLVETERLEAAHDREGVAEPAGLEQTDGARRPSIIAFVATVVPCANSDTWPRNSSRLDPRRRRRAGASQRRRPPDCRARSVTCSGPRRRIRRS